MKQLLILLVLLTGFIQNSIATEATPSVSPYQVIEVTGNSLFTRIANNQEALNKFPELMRDIVEEELMPSVDYQYAAFKILEPETNLKANARSASVDVKIVDTGKPDIKLTFQMRKDSKTQQWKAYDMIVEGISLISTKQSEFNRKISDLGLDQVTIELASITK